jgi:hypothetical protein
MLANGMGLYMEDHPEIFKPIDVNSMQDETNNGNVTLAVQVTGKANESGGHIVMGVPGQAEMTQGTWRGNPASDIGGLPNVMDTGSGKREASQTINYSWGASKQSKVVIYEYMGNPPKQIASNNQTNWLSKAWGYFKALFR